MEEDKCRHGTTIKFSWSECYDCAVENGCTPEEINQQRGHTIRAIEEEEERRTRERAEYARRRAERKAEELKSYTVTRLFVLRPLGCALAAAIPCAFLALVGISVVSKQLPEYTTAGGIRFFFSLTMPPFWFGLFAGFIWGLWRLRKRPK